MRMIFALLSILFFIAAPMGRAGAAGQPVSAVQITLYDLARDARSPAATGRAVLSTREQRARLYTASRDAAISTLPHTRDEFYITKLAEDPGTGRVAFRVRYQQIVGGTCTALEIRDFSGVGRGETCELFSDRGHIRAVLKAV